MIQKPFGQLPNGKEVTAYTISHENGTSMTVLDYGCTIQALEIPDKNGNPVDVVLGYDDATGYWNGKCFFGATIGRYGNRIGKGKFTLTGVEYQLNCNDGENTLHGGPMGFDRQIWALIDHSDEKLTFFRISPDGEEGYPGGLGVTITMTLTTAGKLTIAYDALSDKDTVLSLTNHTYFNLNGDGSAMEQVLQLHGDQITEGDAGCLPTGKFLDVAGTPFDFRTPKPIGQDIDVEWEQTKLAGGYDHNVVLSSQETLKFAAKLTGLDTGITMTTETTEPGMQFYSGNFISEHMGKKSKLATRRSAICLETQKFPDSPNNPHFPSSVLKAGEAYHSETIYTFSV
ncbi:MAG: aldose epimerase family protein [Eubacteriales bacterium]